MDEGASDRSGKRQRSSRRRVGEPPSDAEIAHGKTRERKRKSKPKERWPFYEGLTVDELARYRRRRVQGQPKDHFQSRQESTDRSTASEYRRAFGAEELSEENAWPIKDISNEDEDDLQVDAPYRTSFEEQEMENPLATSESASSQLINENGEIKTTDTPQVKSFFERPSPKRRGTSLKCDGEFCYATETFSAYVPYEGYHRPELARRPTFLRMEGDLDTMTEKCEKFIEWLSVSRPTLMRVPTHLKMEGELETETENKDKYVPFVGVRRPELLRRNTNLKLEGNIFFVPEYTDVFRDYRIQDRLQPKEPHLHGTFPRSTESAKEPTRETVEEIKNGETTRYTKDQAEKRKKDEEMQILVSKLENLNGRPLETPEYRDAYKDFPRERPTIVKPNNEIGRADGSKVFSPPSFKFTAKIDQDPEYQTQHRDYPRDRPIYRKPPSLLRPTGAFSSTRHSACFDSPMYHQDYPTIEYEPCEVKSQYVPCDYVSNDEGPTNLRPDDNIDYLQPEYKSSRCERYDCRGCDDFKTAYGRCGRSRCAMRKHDEDELNGNNDNEYDDKIAPERNAFRVLDTRIDEENRWKSPPPVSTRFNQATMPPRSTRSELADRSPVTARSLSPTYRLHVLDVDNEPRGFSRLKQSSERARDHSIAIQTDAARQYSPSFGKDRQNRRIDHPFVVLDNDASRVTSKPQTGTSCARRANRNVNVIPISRERPKTPTKWMPPWYDSTNAI